MAKRLKITEDVDETEDVEAPEEGEQMQLIDVSHPLAKKLKPLARKYKTAMSERQAALAEEIDYKKKIIETIKADGTIKPNAEGITAIQFDGMTVTIKPRDELVKVKMEEEDED